MTSRVLPAAASIPIRDAADFPSQSVSTAPLPIGDPVDAAADTLRPPVCFLCPLIKTIMMEPVVSSSTGISFEYSAIASWKAVRGDVCPVTGGPLGELVFNHELQSKIVAWRQKQQRAKAIRQNLRRNKAAPNAHASHLSNIPNNNTTVKREEGSKDVNPEMYDRIKDLVRVQTTCNLQQHALKHEGMFYKPEEKKLPYEFKVPPYASKPASGPPTKAKLPHRKSISIFRNGPTLNVPRNAKRSSASISIFRNGPSLNIPTSARKRQCVRDEHNSYLQPSTHCTKITEGQG